MELTGKYWKYEIRLKFEDSKHWHIVYRIENIGRKSFLDIQEISLHLVILNFGG